MALFIKIGCHTLTDCTKEDYLGLSSCSDSIISLAAGHSTLTTLKGRVNVNKQKETLAESILFLENHESCV